MGCRQSLTSEQLRDQWQSYIRGWWNYFQLADWRWEVNDLNGWIRRHMRKCFWLRWHHPRGRINALSVWGSQDAALGMPTLGRGLGHAAALVMHQALKTATLNRYGFSIPWDRRRHGR